MYLGSTLFSCWCPRVKRKHEAEFHSETVEAKGLFMTALQIHDGILRHQDCSGLITHLYHVDKLAFLLRLHAFEKKSEIFAVKNSCSTLIPGLYGSD